MDEHFRIFPTCVLKTNLDRDFNATELKYFNSFDGYANNIGNLQSIDTDVLSKKEMRLIKSFISDKVAMFLDGVFKPKYPIELYVTQSWLNKTLKNMSHHKHWHQNSIVSGVLYVNAMGEHDRIYFSNPAAQSALYIEPREYTLDNSRTWFIPVKTGDLLLFPSWVEHHVENNNHDHERISLAFNTFAKGSLGAPEQLNNLILK